MKLGISERIALLNLLPNLGNFITMKLVRELQHEIEFDEAEIEAVGLTMEETRVTWNGTLPDKQIEPGEKMLAIVQEALGKLDADGTLALQHLTLCEKFGYEGGDDET